MIQTTAGEWAKDHPNTVVVVNAEDVKPRVELKIYRPMDGVLMAASLLGGFFFTAIGVVIGDSIYERLEQKKVGHNLRMKVSGKWKKQKA